MDVDKDDEDERLCLFKKKRISQYLVCFLYYRLLNGNDSIVERSIMQLACPNPQVKAVRTCWEEKERVAGTDGKCTQTRLQIMQVRRQFSSLNMFIGSCRSESLKRWSYRLKIQKVIKKRTENIQLYLSEGDLLERYFTSVNRIFLLKGSGSTSAKVWSGIYLRLLHRRDSRRNWSR